MAHKQTGELKKRAWLAKQRLKMGYWDSVQRGESDDSMRNDEVKRSVAAARARLIETQIDGKAAAREEEMYRKVCEILDCDETTTNPIGQLIDGDLYASLDPSAKQRYILELSEKFRELRERYYREKTGA